MQFIGVFELFKVSVGPSSSHTMGPWNASLMLLDELRNRQELSQVSRIRVDLCGSLARTGRGHQTPMGVIMGLLGHHPASLDTARIPLALQEIEKAGQLLLDGQHPLSFSSQQDIRFALHLPCPVHPNTLLYHVELLDGRDFSRSFYSVGGGFIERDDKEIADAQPVILEPDEDANTATSKQEGIPYPMRTAKDLLRWLDGTDKGMVEIIRANEESQRSAEQLDAHCQTLYQVFVDSVFRGCHRHGILPGGLGVVRRAAAIAKNLYRGRPYNHAEEWLEQIRLNARSDFSEIAGWVLCFALAVNEENATCGRIVTAPTNGAAGVIPAVLLYFLLFDPQSAIERQKKIADFLLVAAQIGFFFKTNASISAAAAGCQGEIGVSSSMAAGALTYVQGGNVQRVLMASEIAMEHHLGLTCDPIQGLVQVPCIERNSMGAMKAITAAHLAFSSDPGQNVVGFDQVVATMWQTAKDMSRKYKETGEGGLAVHVPLSNSEC